MKWRLIAFALALSLGYLPAGLTQTKPYQPFDRAITKQEEKWVRTTLKNMTLDEKIGQMFLADAYITFWNRDHEAYKQLQHHITDNKVGGVLIFRSEVWPTAVLANRWQEMAKVPLLISSDLEMGPGMRFDDTPWWAPNMAVAATGDANFARLQGEATALQARAMGINWLYAPAVDVNNNPDNPVINVRSYGEDPASVSTYAQAFIRGAQGAGALATAKHFPGHGDTATDSHVGLPVVDVSKQRLDQLELVPFKAAIAANVGSIMSAHIALPQLEPELAAPVRQFSEAEKARAEFISRTEEDRTRITLPGTLSNKVLTGLLRQELNFKGIIVTDAMNMAALAARYTPAEAAIKAIQAGADVIIKSPDIDAAIAGVKEAVAKHEIPLSRIEFSVLKILQAKALLSLNARKTVNLDDVDRQISSTQFNAVSDQIAERSITLVRDYQKLLPLRKENRAFVLSFIDENDAVIAQTKTDEFIKGLRAALPTVDTAAVTRNTTEAQVAAILEKVDAGKYDTVVYALAFRAISGRGSVTLPPVAKRLADELIKRHMTARLPLVTISFGNPYMLQAMPDAPSYLLAWSPFPVSQRAAAKAVLGASEINGKLPVTLPRLYERGAGMKVERANQTAK